MDLKISVKLLLTYSRTLNPTFKEAFSVLKSSTRTVPNLTRNETLERLVSWPNWET